jgi:two-component system alkaline phosphatase synthesis response regulator PhoP
MDPALTARLIVHAHACEDMIGLDVRQSLEREGVRILASADWTSLRKLAKAYPADAVLLGLAGPEQTARLAVRLRRLFGRTALPIVVLLAASAGEGAEASAIGNGADDALRAPLNAALLGARLETAVRNAERWSAPAAWPRHTLRTSDGALALDLRARRCLIRHEGAYIDVPLTKRQMETLTALLRRMNRPVSWSALYGRGWHPTKLRRRSRTLVQHILSLRRKLGPAGTRIEAVPGFGYRLRD